MYVALEEVNFTWEYTDVRAFNKLWRAGHSLENIAKYLKRDMDECALLLMDQVREDKLTLRKNGIFESFEDEQEERHRKFSLTKEVYVQLKNDGVEDTQVQAEYGINRYYLNKKKKEWGLVGLKVTKHKYKENRRSVV